MPSSTFDNLSKEKKIRIMKAATKEFSNYTLMDASINRIIKDADISRGSFYMYFKDINDIYKYVIDVYIKKMEEVFIKYLKINQGDLFQSYIDIYDYIIETGSKKANKDFCKKIYTNLSVCSLHRIIEKQGIPVSSSVFDLVDKSKLNIQTDEEFYHMIGILMSLTMRFVIPILVLDRKKEETRKHLLLNYELLKKGFYR